MGSFYDDFVAELADFRRRDAGHPERELLRLYFMALEREELVSVAYHDDLLNRRLESLQLEPRARALVRQALVWTWKDEEMHAVYIRGALLRHPRRLVRLRALYHNVAGLLAGWATFVQQHVTWRRAPVSRLLSTGLLWMGLLTGTAPPSVKKHLRYHSFREFCEFNIDAEKTAALCWERLVELATSLGLEPRLVRAFRQVKDDEDHHRALFEILTEALDERDALATSVDELAARIRPLGERYLPRPLRAELVAESPLGGGGRVVVEEGARREDKLAAFERAIDHAGLVDRLRAAARAASKDVAELRVVIKPTFMLGYNRADPSTITDPELLDALARRLAREGVQRVTVVEAPNLYDRFFEGRGVADVASYFGIASPAFEVEDAEADQIPASFARGMSQHTVARAWKDADFRIVFGKMRSHPVEIVYLCLGTLEGLGERIESFLFADRSADREVATVMLADEFPPHFALLDAYEAVPDGTAGMMGCRRPKSPLRIYAGADALAVDMVAARHMGMADPRRSKLIATACHWFGDPSGAIEVSGADAPITGWRAPYRSEWSTLASLIAYSVWVVASHRGALFVPSMDERTFPVRARPGMLTRLVQRLLRFALGLPRFPPAPEPAPALPARGEVEG
jgi:uncharacterized protein (DUF362 family)